ncbi:hypothetical protein ACT724_00535 [Ornithobacterium rhinotracheale]|uniref:hypothetical protein n=2 Tax=Ornithobacterium rhinotracheale TaxID=28251 RepID=UPI0040362316
MKFNISNYESYLKWIILLASFIGAISQFIKLLIIGEGFWILSYFSVSYIVVEGLLWLLILFLACVIFYISYLLHKYLFKCISLIVVLVLIVEVIITFLILNKYRLWSLFTLPFFIITYLGLFTALNQENKSVKQILLEGYRDKVYLYSLLIFGIPDFLLIMAFPKHKYACAFYYSIPYVKENIKKNELVDRVYSNDIYTFVKKNNLKDEKSYLMIFNNQEIFNGVNKELDLRIDYEEIYINERKKIYDNKENSRRDLLE